MDRSSRILSAMISSYDLPVLFIIEIKSSIYLSDCRIYRCLSSAAKDTADEQINSIVNKLISIKGVDDATHRGETSKFVNNLMYPRVSTCANVSYRIINAMDSSSRLSDWLIIQSSFITIEFIVSYKEQRLRKESNRKSAIISAAV
jgi:hypothetical protein